MKTVLRTAALWNLRIFRLQSGQAIPSLRGGRPASYQMDLFFQGESPKGMSFAEGIG
jgi:hypothetical protein